MVLSRKNSSFSMPHAALGEQHRLGPLHVKHRHAVNRALGITLGGRVGHIVGADDERDVGLRELAVDVVELEDLVVGDVGLGEQHVHVPGHPSGHGVDGVAHLHPLGLEGVGHLAQRMLRLGDRHAVAGHDDDRARDLHDERGVLGAPLLDRALLHRTARRQVRLAPEPAQDHAEERAVHPLAHDVGEDRPRRSHQRPGDDQGSVLQGGRRSRPA